ncbi:hypothetical protein HWV62_39333 [Athelia sp. TMB]|nr:hypothetical protein HWV62_39333 [Athelia sp. TMB]
MASRSADAATKAIAELKDITGREAIFVKLDLSSQTSVQTAANEFLSKEKRLHVLFNNAGVMDPPLAMVSAEGYDYTFATNVIGPYLLTTTLLPALLAGATSSEDGKARVVTLASVMHRLRPTIDFDSLVDGPARVELGETALYAQSKNADIVLSKEIARRYGDRGIVSTAVNPGILHTHLMRHLDSITKMILKPALWKASYGSVCLNGKYLIPWARVGDAQASTQDENTGKFLWAWLENHTRAAAAK